MEKSVLRGLMVDGLVEILLKTNWGTPELVESFARDFYGNKVVMDPIALSNLGGTYEEFMGVVDFLHNTYPLIDILVDVLGAGLERLYPHSK